MALTNCLGVSSSLFNSVLGMDWSESCLADFVGSPIHHIEYLCVEDRFRDEGHIARVKQTAQDSGVTVWSVHAPFGTTDISQQDENGRANSVDNVIRALDIAVELGGRIVVVHGSREPIGDDERKDRLVQTVRSLNELCKRASQRGLKLALEMLPRTCLANRTEEMRWITDLVDGDLRVCYDANHVTVHEDVRESLRALSDRISTFHISDHDGVDERHWLPGRGVTDWDGFVEVLGEIEYGGCLIHETSNPELDVRGNLEQIAQAAREHLSWAGE